MKKKDDEYLPRHLSTGLLLVESVSTYLAPNLESCIGRAIRSLDQ
jgi:hypothetical protein